MFSRDTRTLTKLTVLFLLRPASCCEIGLFKTCYKKKHHSVSHVRVDAFYGCILMTVSSFRGFNKSRLPAATAACRTSYGFH